MTNTLYTIGYASFSMDEFITVLGKYAISVVVDVRSAPFSRFRPEFKKAALQKLLSATGISYIFLGDLLGARVDDSACYRNGKLDYALLKESKSFRAGIKRLLSLIEGRGMIHQSPAILCAEKDPLNCHRMFLVCRTLRSYPVAIHHILDDGSPEEHAITEKRLVQLHMLDQPDMFCSASDLLEEAYDRMCRSIEL